MEVLEYRKAKTKKDLVELYLSQYSEKEIRLYLSDIIKDYRPKKSKFSRNVSIRELLTFIELYGLPTGYVLSEELERIKKYLVLKV